MLKDLLKGLKTDKFVRDCGMIMGYTYGFPIIRKDSDGVKVIIPFLRYKMTGVVDKTEVLPIRYTITAKMPDAELSNFEDLSRNAAFRDTDFNSPAGYFRHESIKRYTKTEYNQKRDELYSLYDKLTDALQNGAECGKETEERFRELLNIMLEPYVKPAYKILDKDFYDKYLA